jgi:hypothetical protein
LFYVVLVWISSNYGTLVCETEFLTIDIFVMLCVAFPASMKLICRAKEINFSEAGMQDTFPVCGFCSCYFLTKINVSGLGPVLIA